MPEVTPSDHSSRPDVEKAHAISVASGRVGDRIALHIRHHDASGAVFSDMALSPAAAALLMERIGAEIRKTGGDALTATPSQGTA